MPRFAEPVPAPSAKKSASRPAAARPPARRLASAQQAGLSRVLQLRAKDRAAAAPSAETPSRAGLPERLKAGVEQLSGLAMDDVHVHRNSPEPARLGALAYTQGSDIHLGPGQDRHLPHEAWHVAQQKQGRVKATAQLRQIGINDDPGLEHEADVMGARALQSDTGATLQREADGLGARAGEPTRLRGEAVAQRAIKAGADSRSPQEWQLELDPDNLDPNNPIPDLARRQALQLVLGNLDGQTFETASAFLSAVAQQVAPIEKLLRQELVNQSMVEREQAVAEAEQDAEVDLPPPSKQEVKSEAKPSASEEKHFVSSFASASSSSSSSSSSSKKAAPKFTEAEARMNRIGENLDHAREAVSEMHDVSRIRAWLLTPQKGAPKAWTEAVDSLTEASEGGEIEGVIAMIMPISADEATPQLEALVENLVAQTTTARSGTASKGAKDYTEELVGPMAAMHRALVALEAEEVRNGKGGEDRLKRLLAQYEKEFGTDMEWQPGTEYFNRDLARRARGFYDLMTNLAEAILAMPVKARANLRGFLKIMYTWQDSTCHNIVVRGLIAALK